MAHKTVSKERTPSYRQRAPTRSYSVPSQGLARLAGEGTRKGDRRMGKSRHEEGDTWHTSEVEEVLRVLGTDAGSGPGNEEAARRLEERGPNELKDRGGRGHGRSCGSSAPLP